MCFNPTYLPDENQYEPCFDCPECDVQFKGEDPENVFWQPEEVEEVEEEYPELPF